MHVRVRVCVCVHAHKRVCTCTCVYVHMKVCMYVSERLTCVMRPSSRICAHSFSMVPYMHGPTCECVYERVCVCVCVCVVGG